MCDKPLAAIDPTSSSPCEFCFLIIKLYIKNYSINSTDMPAKYRYQVLIITGVQGEYISPPFHYSEYCESSSRLIIN
jgi:hypothetical protein